MKGIIIAVILVLAVAYHYRKNAAVPAVGVVVTDDQVLYCANGVYCNGEFVPKEAALIGATPVCGSENLQYVCVNENGAAKWKINGKSCDADMYGACGNSS